MNRIEEIFNSFRIAFNPNDSQMELASMRIEICNDCEFKQMLSVGPGLDIARCTVCGCALKGKIYTPKTYLDDGGSCPKGYWSVVEDKYLNKKITATATTVSPE